MLNELYPNSAIIKDRLVECGPDATDKPSLIQLTFRGIREVNHALYVLLIAALVVFVLLLVYALALQGVKFVWH